MSGRPETHASLRQISPDRLLIEVAGKRIITQAHCPHRRGLLRFGYLNSRTLRITCPLHHSAFDLLTGQQVAGPPCGSLHVELLPEGAAPSRRAPTGGDRNE